MSEIEGGNVRGRPPVKWRDRVQEYVRERGEGSLTNLEQARRECQDRERWKLFCRGHPSPSGPTSRCQNELNRIVNILCDFEALCTYNKGTLVRHVMEIISRYAFL